MGDENHIILHLFTLTNRYFVRIVSVDHTDDYISEINTAYPELQVCNLVPLYNSAEWTSRLFNDIKYKRFKGTTIEPFQSKPGLWEVKGSNQEEWFENEFEPYLRLKLLEYEEDNYEGDTDIIQYILSNIHSIQPTKYIEICSSNITSKADTFKLKAPERTEDGEVILTKNQKLAMILTCIAYNASEMKMNGDYEHDILLRQCEDSDNIYLSNDTFTLKEIPYLLDSFGINYISIIQLTTNNKYRSFVQANIGNGLNEHNVVLPKLGFAYLEDQAENTLDDYYESFYYNVDAEKMRIDFKCTESDIVRKVPTVKKVVPQPEPKEQWCLCMNNITSKLEKYIYTKQYKYLSEISVLCDVNVKTKMGESMFNTLLTMKRDDVDNVIEDVSQFLDIIKTVFQSNRGCNNKGDVLNMQKYHTSNYVEKYKDDNSETMASAAIEKVFMFLSKYISGKDINMNQIGKDLVDLGVKKTRKTRGNVYGMANPSKSDLDKFAKTASTPPSPPITNLPPFTDELVIPADSWDKNPSRIGCGKSSQPIEQQPALSPVELLIPTTDDTGLFLQEDPLPF